MWIKEPGKLTDRLDFIGQQDACLYLLRGKDAMIIGGGMSWVAPSIEKQLAAIDFDPERLKYLVVLHSHFDHCGAVPYLKRKFPRMQILAAAYAREVFAKKKVVDFIEHANYPMIEKLGLQAEYETLNLKFDGIKVERVVREGDVIDLGDGCEVHILEVPGHTECCLAAYVPKLKALFPTDAAPCPMDDINTVAHPSPQYDFALNKKSMERMARLDVDMVAFEHNGVVTGKDAKRILLDGVESFRQYEKYIMDAYRNTGDFEKTARKVSDELMAPRKLDFLPDYVQISVARASVEKVLRAAGISAKASS